MGLASLPGWGRVIRNKAIDFRTRCAGFNKKKIEQNAQILASNAQVFPRKVEKVCKNWQKFAKMRAF